MLDADTANPQATEDWAVIERLHERNADRDPEEVLADATAAVAEGRRDAEGNVGGRNIVGA